MNWSYGLIRSTLLVALGLAVTSSAAWACPACYSEAQGPPIDAARMGAWLLIGVVASMWAGFLAFFICLARRARRFATEPLGHTMAAAGEGAA